MMQEGSVKRRYLFGIVVFLFGILCIRLFQLQVIRGAYYFGLSEKNRIRVVSVPAPRGLIYDRNGQILVDNRPSYTIAIIPFQLRNLEKTAEDISLALDLDKQKVREKLEAYRKRPYEQIRLKRDAGIKAVAVVEENRYELPGVICQVEPRRHYPQGNLAAHILGYVGELSEREFVRLRAKGYLPGETVGKAGVERQYEEFLHGRNGVKYLEVDALGREIRELFARRMRHPQVGHSLYLTIDNRLQGVATEAFGANQGALVAIDPQTGEVLAMVSKPDYDPGLFSGILDPAVWDSLNVSPQHPLFNRAIQSGYPPGSTVKMVAAIAGLELKLVDEQTHFAPCTGAFRFGNRYYGCWKEEGHGSLGLIQGIAQSCDVYFYQLGLKVGLENWSQYARTLGLGKKTGIDLPGEARGLIPSADYYDREYGKGKWTQGLLLNLSIGQGEILVTPLQMACYIGAIATGKLARPHLLKKVVTADGDVIFSPQPDIRDIKVSDSTLSLVRRALLEAVEGEKGTGYLARVKGFHIAGKTGTAQNPHGEDHAWFVAYAPFEQPSIAVAAVVEAGGHGATAAAPIVQKVLAAYLFNNRFVKSGTN
ncbi:MAG: penicillin-binding protein 2 [Candidatus Latescibacterota bacterium]|nr:MAG: penicillin-binding protein 2 [Candidatus Latescibacterota bacterium]